MYDYSRTAATSLQFSTHVSGKGENKKEWTRHSVEWCQDQSPELIRNAFSSILTFVSYWGWLWWWTKSKQFFFQNLRRFFLPGTLKNALCCLNELLVNFRRAIKLDWPILQARNCNEWPTGPVDSCLNELLLDFRKESNGIGRFCRLEKERIANWLSLLRLNELFVNFREESTNVKFSSLQNRPIPLDSSRKLTKCSLRQQMTGPFIFEPAKLTNPTTSE